MRARTVAEVVGVVVLTVALVGYMIGFLRVTVVILALLMMSGFVWLELS